MRLAYDYALGQTLGLSIDWMSFLRNGCVSFKPRARIVVQQLGFAMRYCCDGGSLSTATAQVVGSGSGYRQVICDGTDCILHRCYRSERIRRHLEQTEFGRGGDVPARAGNPGAAPLRRWGLLGSLVRRWNTCLWANHNRRHSCQCC